MATTRDTDGVVGRAGHASEFQNVRQEKEYIMKKDNAEMFVLLFFSVSMLMAGGIACGMELLSSEAGSPPADLPLTLVLVGILGVIVSGVLRSMRYRISQLEEKFGAK